MSEDQQEKPFEPTQQKLEKSRKEGELTLSREIIIGCAFGAITILLMLSNDFSGQIALWPSYFDKVTLKDAVSAADILVPIWGLLAWALLWVFVVGGVSVMAHLAQGAGAINSKRIQPKLSKISPLSGLKAKLENLMPARLLTFLIKLVLLGVCYAYIASNLWRFQPVIEDDLGMSLDMTRLLMRDVFLLAFVFFLPVAVTDYVSKWFKRRQKLMMSFQEMRQEQKESSGNPEQKAKRDEIARARVSQNLREGTEKADVIIVNPTHYAVAIAWTKVGRTSPKCTAKGMDLLAKEIRDIAYERGIPVYHDPKTARSLYATVETGAEIPAAHYRYVAIALKFAMRHTPKRYYEK